MTNQKSAIRIARGACIVALLVRATITIAAGEQTFETPDDAAHALVEAARNNNSEAMKRLFGDSGATLVQDGNDPGVVALRERFAAAADEVLLIEEDSPDHVRLLVGPRAFIYPAPIVKKGEVWSFDSAAGAEEMANRRVGLNELMTMTVLEDLPRVQTEYESIPRDGTGVRQYAQHFISNEGKRDGLYWKAENGEEQSPLGPLLKGSNVPQITSYYGYHYRMLTRQGAAAPGGAYDYLINGNMIAGYAAVAYPAKYGHTGIMTFAVNRYGVVYQKDLGPQTATIAAAITSYDPDSSWSLARDETLDETLAGD